MVFNNILVGCPWLHVWAVLVSCLFSFPGKAYVTIKLRHHVKNIKNGWRGSDVIRHVRTLGAHEKKKQTNKDREIVSCPITARRVTPTVLVRFSSFSSLFFSCLYWMNASGVLVVSLHTPAVAWWREQFWGEKRIVFLPLPHPLRTYLQATSLPPYSCFASYLSRSPGNGDGDGDGSENVTFKMNSRFFKLCRAYSNSLKMSNEGQFFRNWFLEPHSGLERQRKIRRRLFTSFIKPAIRYFHDKKAWCTCKVVAC